MLQSDLKTNKTEKFWEDFYKKSALNEIPFKATFELTHRCNLFCRHCYIPGRQKSDGKSQKKEELSFSEVCSILDQLADIGSFQLNFTGGEPLARPDFFRILTYAKRKGFYVILLTNATLITPGKAEALKDLGLNQVAVSLYGMTPQTYEKVTQVPGSFSRCLKGIRLLKKRDLNISIKMMIMTLNIREFELIKTFVDNLGIRLEWDYLVHPRIDGSKEPLKYRISPEEAVNLESRFKNYLSVEERDQRDKKKLSHKEKEFFYCDAGKNSFAITPFGEMNLCLEYPLPGYDLRRGSLKEGWEELVKYARSAKPDSTFQCRDCEFEEYCQWCPAAGWLEKRDRSACSPYYRELARIRRGIIEE